MRLTQEYTLDIEHRFKYATIVVGVFAFIVLGRLFYLQVVKGSFYRFFSTENSIKEIKFQAPRGMMYDRNGALLVENRPSFDITVIPQYVADPEKTLSALSKLLIIDRAEIDAAWEKRKGQPHYQPLLIKADASKDDVAVIKARKNPWADDTEPDVLRGVDVEVAFKRIYPDGNIASHVLGYVREIDTEKLKNFRDKHPGKYRTGDLIGVAGLEEQWDLQLRGNDGYQARIVNAVGREVNYAGIASQLEDREAVAGTNLVLTLDRELQKIARDAFGEKKGAAVVLDVHTGAVRALFSSPSYDPNKLSGPDSSDYWKIISSGEKGYLLNRAVSGTYPPGSTFKPVNAIAALSEGVITTDENLNCGGAYMFGNRAFHCSRRGGHGRVSLHRAIVSSCDIYFYLTGLRLGVDRLAQYAQVFGLGRLTNIPLAGERSGLVPTSDWKLKRFKVPWQEGETLSVSIGQGYDLVTPIQNAVVAAMIANGGRQIQPHLVDMAYDVYGTEIYRWQEPQGLKQVEIDPAIMKFVKDAMVGVVASPEGTGHAQSVRKVTIGGKTGTAQVVQLDGSAVCRGDSCKDHAWFVGFAPADNPEVAAAVIVEHGGFGASAAAPIVGAMLEKYYEIEKSQRNF